ncbi:MAG: type VI secretion system baseplate subunit TssF, partial [Limnobacter sp.]|nr:type VI secretion system baseplate subunit TssF [Limnobacter sp.]
MNPRFLDFYTQELSHLRHMGEEFARRYPKLASRLALDSVEVKDPHIERLLEGFAFLAARVQFKLDREFPRFCEQLLELLYPGFLAPQPSMAIVRCSPDVQDTRLLAGLHLAKGTRLDTRHQSQGGFRR